MIKHKGGNQQHQISAQRQKRKKPLLGRPFFTRIFIYPIGGFEKSRPPFLLPSKGMTR